MTKSKQVPAFVKSPVLPTVIYCWTSGGKRPDLNQPHWSVDIDSNPYHIYCEYMDEFASYHHGFTYDELEEWLSQIMAKL